MLFFEREIELYVSTVSTGFTTSNTVKLAVLSGTSIDYKEKRESKYDYKIQNTPERINEEIIVGYTNPRLSFSTYAKPYNDTTNDTCVEKLLLESLMGQVGTEAPSSYTINFASVNQLPEVYLWLKIGANVVYYIANAVVKSAEYKLEIDKLVTIDWEVVGRNMQLISTVPDTFTDYSNIAEYIKGKFSAINFSFDSSAFFDKEKIYFSSDNGYTNEGTENVSSSALGNISIQQLNGLNYYDFGTTNADTGRLVINDAPSWTGAVYPNDGVGNWSFEAEIFWDGTAAGTNQYILALLNNNNNNITYQSYFSASIYGTTFYAGTYNINAGPSFAELGITANSWFHLAIVVAPIYRTGLIYINGKPVSSAYFYPSTVNGDPGVASTGLIIGNQNNAADPWFYGGFRNIAITYNDTLPKYWLKFTTDQNPVLDSTVMAIYTDFVDVGPYNYTVTNFSCIDQGTYLDSPQGTTAYFTVAKDSNYNSPDWSIEFRVFYDRSGGTYVSGDVYNDGVRRVAVINNQCQCFVNNSLVCVDQIVNASYYVDSFPKAQWHWVTFERKDGIYLLYINGNIRAANGRKNIIPNTIGTGTATVINYSSSYRCALQYLRVSNKAVRTDEFGWFAPKYQNSSVNGSLPIVNGSIKIENDLEIVERRTLDQRLETKLDHYVKKRDIDIDITGYLKTGSSKSLTTKELYEYLQTYPDFSGIVDLNTDVRVGSNVKNNINFNLPKADISIPEVKITDVITSNVSIKSKQKTTADDDVVITYKQQD